MGMDLSSAHHHQEMASQTLESMLVCTKTQQDKKPRPQQEQALKCPRCDSNNTKFCYYNNYSLTQPRYFCKSCRRYWTKGGTLRNVPVGGGCRKNKRSSSSSSSSSSSKRSQDHQLPHMITPNNHSNPLSNLTPLTYDSTHDLTLAFARLHNQSNGQLGFDHDHLGNPSGTINNIPSGSFLDALRSGFLETPNGYQNFCYGNMGHVENGGSLGVSFGDEMTMVPYEDHLGGIGATTTMKQEYCNGREGENRVLLGFPWQINGGDHGNSNMGGSDHLDSGREMWSGIGANSSSWHGLLNSPLM